VSHFFQYSKSHVGTYRWRSDAYNILHLYVINFIILHIFMCVDITINRFVKKISQLVKKNNLILVKFWILQYLNFYDSVVIMYYIPNIHCTIHQRFLYIHYYYIFSSRSLTVYFVLLYSWIPNSFLFEINF
jgi:hypothetical protein